MKTFLGIARVFLEPDNNTPSDIILARTIKGKNAEDLEEKFLEKLEEIYVEKGEAVGVEVRFFPLDAFNEDWNVVKEIW